MHTPLLGIDPEGSDTSIQHKQGCCSAYQAGPEASRVG